MTDRSLSQWDASHAGNVVQIRPLTKLVHADELKRIAAANKNESTAKADYEQSEREKRWPVMASIIFCFVPGVALWAFLYLWFVTK